MIFIDSTIFMKGEACTAGSAILEGFTPLFDAEAVTRLRDAGYALAPRPVASEFGLGEMAVDCAPCLCVDVTGAPRSAAMNGNQIFIKPTYGTVSRYGIVPVACSGEQIGVLANSVSEAREILAVIAGHDPKDGTSLPAERYDYCSGADLKVLRLNAENFPELVFARPAWDILAAAEGCNNLSRYDGVKFGRRASGYTDIEGLYTLSRTEGFGPTVKQLILYGSHVLSKDRYEQCYDKALRVRRLLKEKLDALFAEYDVLISTDTALALITGVPALVCGGEQYMADSLCEGKLFALAEERKGGRV